MDAAPINPAQGKQNYLGEDSYTLTQNLKTQMDDFQKNLSLFVNNPDYMNPATVQEFTETVKNLHTTCSKIEASSMPNGATVENARIMKNILEGSFLV